MGIQYECCFCHEIFPVEKAVDGFHRGHRDGFLCPRCGTNIKDNLLVPRQRFDDCQKKWLNRGMWLFGLFFLATFFDTEFTLFGYEIALSTLVLAANVIAATLVLIFVPCTRRPGVFMTEPGEKA